MAPRKQNAAKVKDLRKQPVAARKATEVKGGQKLQPFPKSPYPRTLA